MNSPPLTDSCSEPDNSTAFADSCRGHYQKLAKLKNIASRHCLERITIANLKKVIERYQLGVAISVTDGTAVPVFNPKDRWAILRLLDDDYLESI